MKFFLRFSYRLLFGVLPHDTHSEIKLLTIHEIGRYQRAVVSQHALLGDSFAVEDGFNWGLNRPVVSIYMKCFTMVGQMTITLGTKGFCTHHLYHSVCSLRTAKHARLPNLWVTWIYDNLEMIWWISGGMVVVDWDFCHGCFDYLLKAAQNKSGSKKPLNLFFECDRLQLLDFLPNWGGMLSKAALLLSRSGSFMWREVKRNLYCM